MIGARVGKERIDEIKNPELAMCRMQEPYGKKISQRSGSISGCAVSPFGRTSPTSGTTAGGSTSLESAILTNELRQAPSCLFERFVIPEPAQLRI